ncbi:MAG: hypothetical protein JOY62_19315 [Acidobacteriaceae bacterium]|nr:hypothetical protein [Acidobacteriaceae bacterium]MBV9782116.1 hypothetical protein [Acidobacteriaceae bacterium]
MPRTRQWLTAIFICSRISAQSVSPDLFSGLKWRLVGPSRGGRAVAAAGVPGDGRTFYFGAVDGGIWKTTDAGTVWTPIFDDQSVASIGALEVAPSDPNVIYAGTGESDIRSDLASGDGVYKSTDAGRTWKNIGLHDTRQISRIVVHPTNPNIVLVAALGHAYGPNDERGVFLSTNGGETWEKVLFRGPQIGAADLAMSMDEPRIVFAAMWEAHRPPWSTYAPIAGHGSGLYRSLDGGKTWDQLTGHGLPSGDWGRVGVSIAREMRGKRVYATIDAKDAGLYRSDDGGDTWTRVNSDPRITSRAWYFSSITADPNDAGSVYIPNVAFYKLSGGGKTLSVVRGAPGGDDYHQVWIDPANSLRMILVTDQGATVTLDGGETWSTWYNQPTAQLYHVITDNSFPYHLYGTQQDSGSAAIASRTDDRTISSRDFFSIGGSESGYVAPDPKDSNIFYVAGTYGEVARFDRRNGQSQNIAPWPMPAFATEIAQRKYRDPWTPVLIFSPVQPNALYLGTQYVMKTIDGGLHWQKISPDLTGDTRNDTHAKPEGAVTTENAKERGYGVVYTLAPSPLNVSEIWAGSDTGLIHLTRDGGKTWLNVTPKGLSDWSKVTFIEPSHFTPGEAYAAIDRHRLDDMRPYLLRTRDYGKTWNAIVDGIPEHAFLNVLREDPKRKGLLFAGTEFGIYVSFDFGDHWQSLQLNLPVTSVRDLVIHDNDLIAATHGRSFWILDNIAPLRQITHDVANVDSWLFKPDRAIRLTSDAFLGTPLPPEEPQAENPPRGAYIDYYLRHAASGEVTLEIVDVRGKTIRRFSSQDKIPDPPSNAPIAPRWLPKPQRLSDQPGMHRFVWDLRYGSEKSTGEEPSEGIGPRPQPPLVLPGRYKIRLTMNGREFAEPLEVAMDPRSRATPADLLQQLHWAQLAFDDLTRARRALAEIAAVQKQSGAGISNEKQKSSLASLAETLRSSSTGLAAALGALQSADRTPPSQAIALYQESAKTLKTKLPEWDALRDELRRTAQH